MVKMGGMEVAIEMEMSFQHSEKPSIDQEVTRTCTLNRSLCIVCKCC